MIGRKIVCRSLGKGDWMFVAVLRGALTPEWRYPEAKIVWAMRAALVALAIFSLSVTPIYTTRPLLLFSCVSGLVASLLFAFVPTRRPRTLKAAEVVTLAAFLAHIMGHAFGLYARYIWYDKSLHFLIPIVTVFALFALSQATEWIWNWQGVRPFEVAIYLFSMSVAVSAIWEIVEFAMDQIFLTMEQNGNTDTMLDLVFASLGSLVGATTIAITTRYGHTHGMDKVSETPSRPYPARAPIKQS